ncbi:MAG: beta-ketoacyl synthase chain length factor [Myxococcota bacterium]
MNPLFVRGLGLWTPGFSSPGAWCLGDRDPEVTQPATSLLTGALKRRSSEVTRIAIDAFSQAAAQAGCDPAAVPSVWATAHGEHSTALHLLGMMNKGEGKVSPANFHNSVHNTPSAYASISAGNTAPSTTLTGGSELVCAALTETMCLAGSLERDAVVVFADEALKPPFDVSGSNLPLAIAFCLGQERAGSLAQISSLQRNGTALSPHAHFGFLHVSAALPLLEKIVERRPGRVALEFESSGTDPVWAVDVEPVAD